MPSDAPARPALGAKPTLTPRSPQACFTQGSQLHHATPSGLIAIAPVLAMLAVLGLPVVLVTSLDRLGLLPPWLTRAAVTLLILAVLYALYRLAARAYRRGMSSVELPFRADPTARVRVVAWADQALDLAPIPDAPFEPETVRAFLPDKGPAWWRRMESRARPGSVSTLGTLAWMVPIWVVIFGSSFVDSPFVVAGFALAALSVAIFLHRRPTYLRVQPGRAEILRYPTFAGPRATPDITTIDLGAHPVLLDLKSGVLLVGPRAHEPPPLPGQATERKEPDPDEPATERLTLWLIPDRRAAVRALYAASICTTPAPAQPV